MAPSQRRGPWLPQEDQALLQLVQTQGPNNWVRISQYMKYRTPKQCRERFHQNLKPSLSHKPISADEGAAIEQMVNDMGKRWAEIARRLGNRSDNAVKNWWNGSMNRKRRGGSGSSPVSPPLSPRSRTINGRIESPYQKPAVHDRPSFQLPNPGEICSNNRPWSAYRDDVVDDDHEAAYSGNGKALRLSKSSASLSNTIIEQQQRSDLRSPRYSSHHEPKRLSNKPADIVIHQNSTRSDLPLISPSPSEHSNRTSGGPPSMVSDHNSVASTSPKILTSPRLLPTPYEKFHGCDDSRRPGSASSLPAFANQSQSHIDGRPTYGSIAGTESSAEGSLRGQCKDGALPLRQLVDGGPGSQLRHSHVNSSSWYHYGVGRKSREPPRDARMGLQALLN